MNRFLSAIKSSDEINKFSFLKRVRLTTLQVNLGNLCNQSCMHCHIGASPDGRKIMPRGVVKDILVFLAKNKGLILDITGGAPELNPDFDYLITGARLLVKEIIVRSNLTVLFEPGKKHLFSFLKKNGIHLICSLPCYTEANVDAQRGKGVFAKSIKALLMLNQLGYAKDKRLILDIAYNPGGAFLPEDRDLLEQDYRRNLQSYGVNFNRLITITNVPINRFREFLDGRGEYLIYRDNLMRSFNPQAADKIMCKFFFNVGYDGRIYDCDFNQALGWAVKDRKGDFLKINGLKKSDLRQAEIIFGEHCFSCTAGKGSSCQGALVN